MLADGYVSPKVHEDLVAFGRAYGKKNLDALVAKARKTGGRAKSFLLEGVAAHEQIARTARKLRADIVVMRTHGRRARQALSGQRGRTRGGDRSMPGDDRAREVVSCP